MMGIDFNDFIDEIREVIQRTCVSSIIRCSLLSVKSRIVRDQSETNLEEVVYS